MTPKPWYRRWAWAFVFGLAVLTVLFAFFPFFVPVDPGNFESSTGVVWDDFEAANPEAADYLAREARLLGSAWLGFALFSAGIAGTYFRNGDRVGSRLMWIFPTVLVLVGLVFMVYDDMQLGVMYTAVGVLAAVGVLSGSGRRVEAIP